MSRGETQAECLSLAKMKADVETAKTLSNIIGESVQLLAGRLQLERYINDLAVNLNVASHE